MDTYTFFGETFYHPNLVFDYNHKHYYIGWFIFFISDPSKAKRLNQEQCDVIKQDILDWNKKYTEWRSNYFAKLLKLAEQEKITHQEIGRRADTFVRITDKITKVVDTCINGNVYFSFKKYAEYRGFEFFEQHPGLIENELDAIIKRLKL